MTRTDSDCASAQTRTLTRLGPGGLGAGNGRTGSDSETSRSRSWRHKLGRHRPRAAGRPGPKDLKTPGGRGHGRGRAGAWEARSRFALYLPLAGPAGSPPAAAGGGPPGPGSGSEPATSVRLVDRRYKLEIACSRRCRLAGLPGGEGLFELRFTNLSLSSQRLGPGIRVYGPDAVASATPPRQRRLRQPVGPDRDYDIGRVPRRPLLTVPALDRTNLAALSRLG